MTAEPSSIGTPKEKSASSKLTKKTVPTADKTIQQLCKYISQRKKLLNRKGRTISSPPTQKKNPSD